MHRAYIGMVVSSSRRTNAGVRSATLQLAGIGMLMLCAASPVSCNSGDKSKKIDQVIHVKADDVQEIELRPSGYRDSLLSKSIRIEDRRDVESFCEALNAAKAIHPSQPDMTWSLIVALKTRDNKTEFFVGHTEQSENGTLVYIFSGAETGWLYGVYRSDSLAKLIDKLNGTKPEDPE